MELSIETFKTHVSTLLIETNTMPEFVNITQEVVESVEESGIQNGTVTVFSRHTTAGITIQEDEPILLNDMSSMLDRLFPRTIRYGHNDFSIRTVHMEEDECPNGHSHCQHLIVGNSETIPIIGAKLALGKWQNIFLVEVDEAKIIPREVLVQSMGI